MTNINTNQHCLVRNFGTELHAPQITAKFSIHLADNVEENTVIVFGDRSIGNELGNNWRIAVDLVFNE